MLPVIFRKYEDGEVVALLPTMPAGAAKRQSVCLSFTTKGGLDSADTSIVRTTKEAKPRDYREVLNRLMQQFPHEEIRVFKRVTEAMQRERNAIKHRHAFLQNTQTHAYQVA